MSSVLAAVVVVALMLGGQSATRPNFSGEWRMNVAKSSFGAMPAPTSIVRSIKHGDPSLTIVEEQDSAMGDQKITRIYTTDGRESSFDAMGTVMQGTASWTDDSTLQVDTRLDAFGLSFTDKMSLAADGKTLTSLVHVSSPQGDVDLTIVFDRQ